MDLWCLTGPKKKKRVNRERRRRQRNGEGRQDGVGVGGGGQCDCLSIWSSGSSSQKVQMCECERGFRFWLKACLGERGFRLLCVGVSAVLIIIANSEAITASELARKHAHLVGFTLNHLFAFGHLVL